MYVIAKMDANNTGYQNAVHTRHIPTFFGTEYPHLITKYNFRLLLEEEYRSISEIKRVQHMPSAKFYEAIGRDEPPAEFVNSKPDMTQEQRRKHLASRTAAWKHQTGGTKISTSKYHIEDIDQGRQYFWKAAREKAQKEGKPTPPPLVPGEYLYLHLTEAHQQHGHLSRDRMYAVTSQTNGAIQKAFVAKFVSCCCQKATAWNRWAQVLIEQVSLSLPFTLESIISMLTSGRYRL